MRLSESFYQRKVAECQRELEDRELAGLLIFDPRNIWYLTGFFHIPTERPVIVFIPAEGEPALFIPKLEEDQVQESWLEEIHQYFEYPGVKKPLDLVTDFLREKDLTKSRLAYEGNIPVGTLRALQDKMPEAEWVDAGDIISTMRLVKEPEELELIQKAAEYSDFMLEEGVRIVKERGLITELELLREVVARTTDKMLAELDSIVYVGGVADGLICSGERSAFPHGLPSTRRLRRGENLILSFGCVVGGYNAESERTFFLGEPSKRQTEVYEVLKRAQEEGTRALKADVPCSQPNRECLGIIRQAGLGEYIKHRQGHGIGIANHEPPWIEDGDETILKPNMVVSSEPGIYIPGEGGFRISDTVLVTPAGPRRLTRFSRDLTEVIIEL